MTDADLEAFYENLRQHYKLTGERNRNPAHGSLGDVAVAFEQWFFSLSSPDTPSVTHEQVIDATASLCTTILARVIDPVCENAPEAARAVIVGQLISAMEDALLVPPDDRYGTSGFSYVTSGGSTH